MRRRSWLKLGAGAAALLALGGGMLALVGPGWQRGRLAPAGRRVFLHVGRALLDGSLPTDPGRHAEALHGLLDRVDRLVAGLPSPAQQELSQLLALLDTRGGRRLLAGLRSDWADASVAQIQQALQSMRVSSIALRQQSYLALHDIAGAAYFADPASWDLLGYPGPLDV